MKTLIGTFLCILMMTLSACGPTARDLEVQRLTKVVETLQGQLVAQDQRLETLSNKMIVIKEVSHRAVAGDVTRRPDLEVVRLTPEDVADTGGTVDTEMDEEPIVLRLRGTPKEEKLPVVPVAAPPALVTTKNMEQAPERTLFVEALEHHGAGRLEQAGVLFEKLLGEFPKSKHIPSAHFWLGECHYESKRPGVAIAHFTRVFTDYPKHTKAAGALLKTGLSYKNMKRIDDARTTFSVLLTRYPRSAEAELARAHLGSMQSGGS